MGALLCSIGGIITERCLQSRAKWREVLSVSCCSITLHTLPGQNSVAVCGGSNVTLYPPLAQGVMDF